MPLLKIRKILAEAAGFEPAVSFPTLVFKTSAFGRSATPPRHASACTARNTFRVLDSAAGEEFGSTALLVVLVALRRRGCAIGLLMLNARDMQPGVSDSVESVVKNVILVRKLVEYAELAQHRNMFGLRGCE